MSGSKPSIRPSSGRPTESWVPAIAQVWGVYPRKRTVWVRNSRTGARERRTRTRYDVRFHVDGHEFRRGFEQKGWADEYVQHLMQDFAKGRPFDPTTRRFVASANPVSETEHATTYFEHACDHLQRQWDHWQPATRRNAQRDLSLACLFLTDDGVPRLTVPERVAADRYLRRVALMVPVPSALSADEQAWGEWFAEHSMPLRRVSDVHLEAFIDWIRSESLDGRRRRLGDTSVARTRAVVRATFTSARRRRLIEWDPWDAVESMRLRDHEKVDPDLVLNPDEVRRVAAACGDISPRWEGLVLVQGLCGLRPGEAAELRRRDLHLDRDRPTVTARATHSAVPERFFVEGEDRRRPLKGRGRKARRSVPVPSELVPLLRRHLDEYVHTRRDAVVFTNSAGGRVNSSNFSRDVWGKVRVAEFDSDSPLRRVHQHDLRHSAITIWLNAGVPLKTVQAWSGHKSVAVLLDTYLGVMKGDEAVARQRWEAALRGEMVTGS